jgi:hypothetical protein
VQTAKSIEDKMTIKTTFSPPMVKRRRFTVSYVV